MKFFFAILIFTAGVVAATYAPGAASSFQVKAEMAMGKIRAKVPGLNNPHPFAKLNQDDSWVPKDSAKAPAVKARKSAPVNRMISQGDGGCNRTLPTNPGSCDALQYYQGDLGVNGGS